MAQFSELSLNLRHYFDPRKCRHYINDEPTILHCHHYTVLYTQLAMDCDFVDAKKLLAEAMEDCSYRMLTRYFNEEKICSVEDRIHIAEEYYSALGLGKMKFIFAGDFSGEVVLESSHVDEGWIKKWGKFDKPVNYITVGFISAVFAAVFNKPTRSYSVTERESIVCGAPVSRFAVVAL